MTRNGTSSRWQTAHAAFRQWRGSRPFWGGLLIVLSGTVILAAPALNPLDLIVQQGIAGISGYFAGLLLMAVGVLVWLQPPQRAFYGIAAVLLALVSFVTSNFGGFVFGMLFGLVGGALTAAWVPERAQKPAPESTSSSARKRLAGLRGRRVGRTGEAATEGRPASGDAAGKPETGSGSSAPEAGSQTGPAYGERGTALKPGDCARDSAEDAPGAGATGSRVGGATYFTSSYSGDTASGQHRRQPGSASEPGTGDAPAGGDETPGGGRMHSLAALDASLGGVDLRGDLGGDAGALAL
ncbi:DUF6114 domain-containing protein, partial [Streptomonospora algeriensis]